MNQKLAEIVCEATGADACFHIEDIQSLWSGYGKIMRYGLKGGGRESVVIKYVQLPDRQNHPRGWNTDRSHQRKVRSYQVESTWYRDWSQACDDSCRIPGCLALESHNDNFLMIFEDLDASGFPLRKESVSLQEIHACLRWLANFHATFMGQTPTGLWPIGTYWHLDTRPEELSALEDGELKQAAAQIDQLLRSSHFQTFVHGDAKLANFCFSDNRYSEQDIQVAAVDFQYVGGGCGMKDVAYFIGSCLHDDECERYEALLLDSYFSELKQALELRNPGIDFNALVQDWRALYPVAWTDFHRFLKGWSPGHWKIHSYSERIAHKVVNQLNKT